VGRIREFAKRIARDFHPFVMITADGKPWPVDTDRASEIADRLWDMPGGRDASTVIQQAVAVRAYARVNVDDLPFLARAISEWIDEVGEEAVGQQVLDLQAAIQADLTRYA
jgi:hypothetical protein